MKEQVDLDALENEMRQDYLSSTTSDIQCEVSLEDALTSVPAILDEYFNNQVNQAYEKCEKHFHSSLYHSLGSSFMKYVSALLHLEKTELQAAQDSVKKTIALADKYRKRSTFLQSMGNILRWKSTDYDEYSDEAAHAELITAEMYLVSGVMTFLGEQSTMSMIRAALRFKSANSMYRNCRDILNKKANWSSTTGYENFRSGCLMGTGIFNLFLSHLPSSIIRLLSMVGFSGDYSAAVEELQEVTDSLSTSVRSSIVNVVVLLYALYVEYIFGVGSKSHDWVERSANNFLKKYPQGAIPLLFAGRLALINGETDKAFNLYTNCIQVNVHLKALSFVGYWDLAWCSAQKLNWLDGAEYTLKVNEISNYSPAIMTYQYACFLLMHLNSGKCSPGEEAALTDKIQQAMEQVPKLRIRYAGKTIPLEKFAMSRAMQFTSGERTKPVLPIIELYYLWNMFAYGKKNKASHEPFLKLINKAIEDTRDLGSVDDRCLLLLLKGVASVSTGATDDAIKCFNKVIDSSASLQRDHWLPPHATLELGMAYLESGDTEQAKVWLEKARSDYSGFLIEAMIQLKVHAAFLSIRRQADLEGRNLIGNSKVEGNNNKNHHQVSDRKCSDDAACVAASAETASSPMKTVETSS